MAPVNFWPVLFLTLPTLVWLIDGQAPAAGAASRCGRGDRLVVRLRLFCRRLYWIGYAFLVDAPTFGWLLPFAVIGLPACWRFIPRSASVLARLLWARGALRILAFGVALTAAEWLRGHLLTGFPWNTLGYALTYAAGAGANRFAWSVSGA